MNAGKALSFLSIVTAILIPTIAIAQTPAAPNGASPKAPAGLARPAPAKPTAPISPADAARADLIGAEPEATTATYGDWIVRCQRTAAASGTQQLCDLSQTVQAQQNPILQLSIGPPSTKGPIKLTIVVPVNVLFPSVARVAIDDKDTESAELTWRRCLPGGCVAELEVKDELLKRWRAQVGGGAVKIVDAAGREITIPVSFRGLSQALDALLRN
jgi:invasion protein IalB